MSNFTGFARLEFIGSPTSLDYRAEGSYRLVRSFKHLNAALAPILHLGPGMVGGDHYRLEVEVFEGAIGVVVNPAAQLILKCPSEPARAQVELQVHSGGTLIFLPSPTLAYPGAKLRQTIHIELESGAQLAWLEVYRTSGFAELSLRTWAKLDARPSLVEGLELAEARGTGVLDGQNALGSALIYPCSGPDHSWNGGYLASLPAHGYYGRSLAPDVGTLLTVLFGLILENTAEWGWLFPEFFRYAPALSQRPL